MEKPQREILKELLGEYLEYATEKRVRVVEKVMDEQGLPTAKYLGIDIYDGYQYQLKAVTKMVNAGILTYDVEGDDQVIHATNEFLQRYKEMVEARQSEEDREHKNMISSHLGSEILCEFVGIGEEGDYVFKTRKGFPNGFRPHVIVDKTDMPYKDEVFVGNYHIISVESANHDGSVIFGVPTKCVYRNPYGEKP